MARPLLVIVGGASASGKTTLGRWLAAEFRMPYIGKDDIKESLYDSLGIGDLAWSRRLGSATVSLLYLFIENELRAGRSLVAESNFDTQLAVPELSALIVRYNALPFQILCQADPAVLQARYQRRATSGERHPGHLDHLLGPELTSRINYYALMPLGGESLVLDTTNPATIDYRSVARQLQRAIDEVGTVVDGDRTQD
jgi:predicted kinase